MTDKNRTVGIEIGITHNVGNYESVRVAVRFEEPVPPGEDRDQVFESLREEVRLKAYEVLRDEVDLWRRSRSALVA